MNRGAFFSSCRSYRYGLWREWGELDHRVTFVMLNPSTADAERDDPTIRKCIALALRWGFGALDVVNLFAWRTTEPRGLLQVGPRRAVGRHNDRAVRAGIERASRVVLAWGSHPALGNAIRSRAATTRDAILALCEASDPIAPSDTSSEATRARTCTRMRTRSSSDVGHARRREIGRGGGRDIGHLGCNDDGSPKHPLYLPSATRFVAIEWQDRTAWPLGPTIGRLTRTATT